METFVVQATGEVPTEFDGELVNKWSGHWVKGRDRNRYFIVELYRTDEGVLVVLVEWHTHWQGERDHTAIFDCENESQILDLLESINPLEHLVGFPKGDNFAGKQAQLERQTIEDWRDLKGQIAVDLGIKQPLKRRGKPAHPLGVCSNPGWSIPQQVIEMVDRYAHEQNIRPSEAVATILANHFGAK